ncbi:hypothetical protein GCM10017557_63410 [Streptomyces aurantiacus]|uniref:Uncharacterized protein n=1 Tax=Streptomyces aurantiacus TaxID=47760 RepID=A0A7G1P8U5_9ACTN|nr:hypothetical protein GCM10017557_63410 [Streptomyces aurantiacus]
MNGHGIRVGGRGEDHRGDRGTDGGDGERGYAYGRLARQRNPSGDVRGRRDEGEVREWSVTRVEAGVRSAARAFLRASISCLAATLVKVFWLNTSDRFMNRAAWAQIRLG